MKKPRTRNIYCVLILLLVAVIVWMICEKWFCKYDMDSTVNPMDLISLIITTGVAVYLGHTITKGLSEERFDKEYIIKDLNSLDDTLSSFISYIQNAKEIDINECGDKIEDIRVGISKFKHSVDIFQVKISNVIQIDTIFEKLYKQGTSQVGQVIMGKDAPKDSIIKTCQDLAKEIRSSVKQVNQA